MNKKDDLLQWVVVAIFGIAIACGGIYLHRQHGERKGQPKQELPLSRVEPKIQPRVDEAPAPKKPRTPAITTPVPDFVQYAGVIDQIKKWNKEAPDLTEIKTYGKSKRGTDLYYIRVTNTLDDKPKPVVLIHACIHGNEPHSTTTVMAYVGTMLAAYGKEPEITELIDTRDIYFVPVMCVDSFPNSRQIDGVDPNRDYPGPSRPSHKSTPCVSAMQDLFSKINPKAVISGHTHGRIFLTPWGDQMQTCPNEQDYGRIVGKMAQMCQYKKDRACNMYGRPIHGSELDWYYRKGAFSIVMEFGTHQQPPSPQEVREEFQRTYKSVLYFIQESPGVVVNPRTVWDVALTFPDKRTVHLPIFFPTNE